MSGASASEVSPRARATARAVGEMFDQIAGRYDLMNRLMSAGQDRRWRRAAVRSLGPLPAGLLLDVGVGTGDLGASLCTHFPTRRVVGLDLSSGMLRIAMEKCGGAVGLTQGDVLRLPFPSGTFAGAATAFTLRNVADLDAALREIERVLVPGGGFVCLEITRPGAGVLAGPFSLYFQRLVPRLGGLIAGNRHAYRYLPSSVERFVTGEQLAVAMRAAGFAAVRMRRFWPGAVTLHAGRKPAGAGGNE